MVVAVAVGGGGGGGGGERWSAATKDGEPTSVDRPRKRQTETIKIFTVNVLILDLVSGCALTSGFH